MQTASNTMKTQTAADAMLRPQPVKQRGKKQPTLPLSEHEKAALWATQQESKATMPLRDAHIALRMLVVEACAYDAAHHPDVPAAALRCQWREVLERMTRELHSSIAPVEALSILYTMHMWCEPQREFSLTHQSKENASRDARKLQVIREWNERKAENMP